jgi:hypothetical protein
MTKGPFQIGLYAFGDYNKIVNRIVREKFMKYKVNLQETSEGYSVWVPGETVEELSQDKKSSYVEVG